MITSRNYDYLLGGKDNYEADRVATEQVLKVWPGMAATARANRAFLGRAVYARGAVTVQALRVRVGDPLFFRILRTYAARYRYGSVTTKDFIVVADQVSGQNLDGFFTTWLYAPAPPPMPPLLPAQ